MSSFMAAPRLGSRVVNGIRYWYWELNRKRVSLGINEIEARKLFSEIKKQYFAGKLAEITGKCTRTLGEFRDEYIELMHNALPTWTFRTNRLSLNKLIEVVGETTKLDRIRPKHADRLRANHSKLNPSSVNTYIRHARAALNKAVEWDYIKTNPLAGVKEMKVDKPGPIFLDKAQMSHLISSIADIDLRRMIVAYLVTGRRRSELVYLKWSDVDLVNGRYKVRTKGGRMKSFYINSIFRTILTIVPKTDERVFPRWQPGRITHLAKEALRAAGFGHLHLHHLRHTYASHKAIEGCSLFELKDLLGHANISATMIYTHLTDTHLADISEVYIGPVDLG